MNYRNIARNHLESAEKELRSNDDLRLKYAALELRMTMEALTYDRALAYKDEFPPSGYDTWQPRKVMSLLLDIDPMADQDYSLSVGRQEQPGVPASEMTSLGADKVLNMKVLKKHYDALGSYLHILPMKQMRDGAKVDLNRMRLRCDEIVVFINKVLESPIFNVTLGNFSAINCRECENPIRKRIPFNQSEITAECFLCGATYTLIEKGDNVIEWMPHQQEVVCANSNCDHKTVVWHHEFKLGNYWKCAECNGENAFVLAIKHHNEASEEQ